MSLTPDFTQTVSSVLQVLLHKLHGIEYADCQKTKALFRYILSHFTLNTIMDKRLYLMTLVAKMRWITWNIFFGWLIIAKYYYFNTTNIFTLTFRSLSETFIRRSLCNSSSGSFHNSDATGQEISRTCGSACSSPCPGSMTAVLLSEYVLPLWSI